MEMKMWQIIATTFVAVAVSTAPAETPAGSSIHSDEPAAGDEAKEPPAQAA